jgi:DNA-directed RNA polymerase specialized sigma24 family protein
MLDLDEPARLWIYKIAHKQFWRVSRWYEFDDLVQDGFMKFYHVRAHYPKVKDQPHLMALFKVAFLNHIHLLASRRTNSAEACFLTDLAAGMSLQADHELDVADAVGPPQEPYALLFTALCNAPAPVVRLLEKIASEPRSLALSAAYRKRRDGTKETLNQRLCRLVKLDPATTDMVSMIKDTLAA